MSEKAEIDVFNTRVRVVRIEESDCICLTDLARYKSADSPDMIIRSWLNTRREVEFLQEWELAYNPDFKTTTSSSFKGLNKVNKIEIKVFAAGKAKKASTCRAARQDSLAT